MDRTGRDRSGRSGLLGRKQRAEIRDRFGGDLERVRDERIDGDRRGHDGGDGRSVERDVERRRNDAVDRRRRRRRAGIWKVWPPMGLPAAHSSDASSGVIVSCRTTPVCEMLKTRQ